MAECDRCDIDFFLTRTRRTSCLEAVRSDFGTSRKVLPRLVREIAGASPPPFHCSPSFLQGTMPVITITRHLARRLHAVLRRSVLGISQRGLIPPLVLHAEGQHLRAQFRYHDLAVEHVAPGSLRRLDSIPVPLEVLTEVECRDDSTVEIESVEPDRIIVRWQDGESPGAVSIRSRHSARSHRFLILRQHGRASPPIC